MKLFTMLLFDTKCYETQTRGPYNSRMQMYSIIHKKKDGSLFLSMMRRDK